MKFFLKIKELLLFALVINGCSGDDLPVYTELNKLRVVAIQLSQSEVNPGATGVVVTPLISDTNGGGRTITYTATGCIDPGISYGAEPTCDQAQDALQLSAGTITSLNAANNYTEFGNTFSVNAPAEAIIFATRPTQDKYNGVAYLIDYKISSGNEEVRVIKRLIVTNRTSLNQNPSIDNVYTQDAPVSAYPESETDYIVKFNSEPKEEFVLQNSSGVLTNLTEEITVTWFFSRGEFKFYRTGHLESNRYIPVAVSASDKTTWVVVVSDGRGGSAAKIIQFP
jgi:hypothetical protein